MVDVSTELEFDTVSYEAIQKVSQKIITMNVYVHQIAMLF
jgi:hypothetical protein